MSRRYKTFTQRELEGGINLEDSPNEIDNKQCLEATNFNSSGNKLVSAKDKVESGILHTSPIQALTLDGRDVWTIEDGKIFKGGTLLSGNKFGAFIRIAFDTNVGPFGGYYSDLVFYIIIDGVEYEARGSDSISKINSLILQLDGVYDILPLDGGVFITSDNPITITAPYSSHIVFTEAGGLLGASSQQFIGIGFYINGKYIQGINEGLNSLVERYDKIGNIFDKIIPDISSITGGPIAEIKKVDLQKDTFFQPDDINYWRRTTTIIEGYGLLINKVESIDFSNPGNIQYFSSTINGSGGASVDIDGVTFSSSATNFPAVITDLSNQIELSGYKTDIISRDSGYIWINTQSVLSVWNENDGPSIFSNGIVNGGTTDLILNSTNQYDYIDLTPEFTVSVEALIENSNISGIVNLTVGNTTSLVVRNDGLGAFIIIDGIIVEIGQESVGKPTLGTIYQGKIVLGGYPDNDNIVFSQTSSITEPLNVLNFGAYNAGGQSVSGGNKDRITGFYVSENGLYVFKEGEIWYTNSENDFFEAASFNFVFRKITDSGAYSQQTITGVNQDIFFLDWINRKVRRLSYEQNLTTLRDTSISNEIDKLFETLPEDQRLATASFKYPNYKLYLSDHTGGTIEYSNGETYFLNNKCFVYNVSEKSWFTEDDKTSIIIADKGYLASSDGKVYIDDKDRKTSGSFLSKEYDMGESVGYKRYTHFDIYGVNSEEIPLYLDIYEDGELLDSYLIENNYGTTFRRRFDLWTEGRYFQFGLRYEGKSNIEIHDFSVNFKELKGYDTYQG